MLFRSIDVQRTLHPALMLVFVELGVEFAFMRNTFTRFDAEQCRAVLNEK